MEHSTRMALERYRSVLLFMSFISELVMMMTSSDPGAHVLDHQVHHPPQVGVLALVELGHAEEHLRRLFLCSHTAHCRKRAATQQQNTKCSISDPAS